jgi:hypothetical protein
MTETNRWTGATPKAWRVRAGLTMERAAEVLGYTRDSYRTDRGIAVPLHKRAEAYNGRQFDPASESGLLKDAAAPSVDTQDDLDSLVQRAGVLLATCDDAIDAYYPNELAATVRRKLYLPEISALRRRLVAEFPAYSSIQSSADEEITAGVAGAFAMESDGSFSAVIDWKSDVAPSPDRCRL